MKNTKSKKTVKKQPISEKFVAAVLSKDNVAARKHLKTMLQAKASQRIDQFLK